MWLDHGVVLVLAEQDLGQRRIARLLSPLEVLRSRCLPATSQQLTFGAVVILAPDCRSEFAHETCAEVRRRGQEGCGILVTEFDAQNVRALPGVWSGNVIWDRTAEVELKREVERLLTRDLRQRVFGMLSTLFEDPEGPLTRGLRAVLLDALPPLTHRELASAAGVSERKFRDCWREAGLLGRSEALIDWGLMTRVVSERREGESLARVCYRIGIEPWRIQRAAKRRVGISAGKLDEERLLKALRAWAA